MNAEPLGTTPGVATSRVRRSSRLASSFVHSASTTPFVLAGVYVPTSAVVSENFSLKSPLTHTVAVPFTRLIGSVEVVGVDAGALGAELGAGDERGAHDAADADGTAVAVASGGGVTGGAGGGGLGNGGANGTRGRGRRGPG